jgi:hypothetical protein
MASAFEPDLGGTVVAGLFHGHMETVVSTDPHGRTPTTVISLQDDWHLQVDWEFHGTMIRAGMLGGRWHVQAVLESIGPGSDRIIADRFVDIQTGGAAIPLGRKYSETFIIGPNVPKEPGVYWLATIITSVGVNGVPGPFAGYYESPTLMFHSGESLPQP